MSSADDDASPQHPPAVSAQPPGALPSGWVSLVRSNWLTAAIETGSWFVLSAVLVGYVVRLGLGDVATEVKVVVWVGVVAAAFVGVLLWFRFKPVPQVNFDTSEFRLGRRPLPMSDIRWALLIVLETKKSRSITLRFGSGVLRVGDEGGGVRRPSYVVRTAHGETPPAETAHLVAELLRRSSIELPETAEDPTGKFTWFNFPGSLTKEQAIEVVLNPPAFGDPLPIRVS